MLLFEGGNFNTLKDVEDYEGFNRDGYCTYKGAYCICLIDFFNKNGSNANPLMRTLSTRAREEGLEFPKSFDSEAEFFLCTVRGLPYDGSKKYDRCYFNNIEEVVKALRQRLNESLREQIRTAIREDTKARKYIKWNPDSQPNLYQLDLFLRKSGYRLTDVVAQDNNPEVLIEPLNPSHLAPDILHQPGEGKFFIDVKKYGELEYSDVEELIKGYTTAVEVVKHLEKLDLSKLEYEKEDQGDDQSESGSFSEEAPRK